MLYHWLVRVLRTPDRHGKLGACQTRQIHSDLKPHKKAARRKRFWMWYLAIELKIGTPTQIPAEIHVVPLSELTHAFKTSTNTLNLTYGFNLKHLREAQVIACYSTEVMIIRMFPVNAHE